MGPPEVADVCGEHAIAMASPVAVLSASCVRLDIAKTPAPPEGKVLSSCYAQLVGF
jgi:hypothetical protein